MTPALRLAVSPLSWVNEVLPEFGAGSTAEQILADAQGAGYTGVELSRVFPRDPVALRALLERHSLVLASGWHNGFLADRSVDEELEAVADHARLLRHGGANVMVYGECGYMAPDPLDVPMSGRLTLGPKDWRDYGARLTRFADALQDEFGLGLSYHHHLMMVAENLPEIDAVMAATGPSVGLLLDTGHALAGGFNYASLIQRHGSRINHIHLKDVRAAVLAEVRNRDLTFNDAVRAGMFTVPGDGDVDWIPLAQFLASGSYGGWLVVEAEQDPRLAPPLPAVQHAFRFVNETLFRPTSQKEGGHFA